MNAQEIVRSFCEAVPRRDPKELAGFFSADAIYHNIPIAPVTGPEEIEKMLGQFLGPASEAEFEVLTLAVDGHRVLTGACPSIALVQVGEGKILALVTMAGIGRGVLGILVDVGLIDDGADRNDLLGGGRGSPELPAHDL